MEDLSPTSRRRRLLRPEPIAFVAVVLMLVGLAPASALAAHLSELPPPREPSVVITAQHPDAGPAVRELPVGLPGGPEPVSPTALHLLAVEALGVAGAEQLAMLLGPDRSVQSEDDTQLGEAAYPNHFAPVDRLVDAAPEGGRTAAAARLGAALVALVGQGQRTGVDNPHPSAAPIAYALLDRARHVAGCDAETDLLLLLASDNQPHDDVVAGQADIAEHACPGDPTPGWLLAQFQSRRARQATVPDLPELEKPIPADAFDRARRTAGDLVARFPDSAEVWSAAGDVHLRAGLELSGTQPFTGRAELVEALRAYQHAVGLGGGAAARVGQARTLTELGRGTEATTLMQTVVGDDAVHSLGPGLVLLAQAQEASREFAAVAATAGAIATAEFPGPGPLFPRGDPLSLGFDRTRSLDVILAPCCGGAGGGDVEDLSFLPVSRPDQRLIAPTPECSDFARRRDLLLAGQAEAASSGLPENVTGARPERDGCGAASTETLREVIEVDLDPAGAPTDVDGRDRVFDAAQNLYRWAGQLDRAAAVTTAWDRIAGGGAVLPVMRLGEIRHLQGRDDAAAEAFGRAGRLAQDGNLINFDQAGAWLARDAVLLTGGRADEGVPVLRSLADDLDLAEAEFRHRAGGVPGDDATTAHHYSVLAFYAHLQLGDAERRTEHWAAAIEDYEAARSRLPLTDPINETISVVHPGALHDNEALALMSAGRTDEARASADLAVEADPRSPIFLFTAGSAAQQGGDEATAIRRYGDALAQDPAVFPAWNNLGVLLAGDHRPAAGAAAFRRAVGARPDYATAWFDLGVLESRRGPAHLLLAQGAYARAFALDPALRDHPRSLVVDEHTYRTGVDVSRPIPAGWSFAAVEGRQPVGALGLLAVLGVVVAASSAAGGSASGVQRWLESGAAFLGRTPVVRRCRGIVWAGVATAVTFAVAAAWRASGGATATTAFVGGVVLLTVLVLLARRLVAEHWGVRIVQRTWPPGLILGVASGAMGVPWAPLPYVRAPLVARRIHLVAPVCLALIAVGLLLESALWPIPLTQQLAVVAATMTASLLLPLRPMDGGAVAAGGQLVVGIGAVAGLLFLVLGLG